MADGEDKKKKKRKSNKAEIGALMEGAPSPVTEANKHPVTTGANANANAKANANANANANAETGEAKQDNKLPYTLDGSGGLWLNRQSLKELGGGWDEKGRYKGNFMDQWRSSDAYKGAKVAQGWRSDLDLPNPGQRGLSAGDIRQLQRMQSDAKSLDYRARQQASSQRADSFYELWKQRYGTQAKSAREDAMANSKQGGSAPAQGIAKTSESVATPSKDATVEERVRATWQKASAANAKQAADAMEAVTSADLPKDINKPTPENERKYKERQEVGGVIKGYEEVTGKKYIPSDAPAATNLPNVSMTDVTPGEGSRDPNVIAAGPVGAAVSVSEQFGKDAGAQNGESGVQQSPKKDEESTSPWWASMYGAIGGGNSVLGSDGRYHRFSILKQAAYSGGKSAPKQSRAIGSSTNFNFGTPDDRARVIRFDNDHKSVSERKSYYARQAARDKATDAMMAVADKLLELEKRDPRPVSPPRAVWNAMSGAAGSVWDSMSGAAGSVWDSMGRVAGSVWDSVAGTMRSAPAVNRDPAVVRMSPKDIMMARRNARFLDGLSAEVKTLPSYSAPANGVPMAVTAPVPSQTSSSRTLPSPYSSFTENPFSELGDLVPVQAVRKTWEGLTRGHRKGGSK